MLDLKVSQGDPLPPAASFRVVVSFCVLPVNAFRDFEAQLTTNACITGHFGKKLHRFRIALVACFMKGGASDSPVVLFGKFHAQTAVRFTACSCYILIVAFWDRMTAIPE